MSKKHIRKTAVRPGIRDGWHTWSGHDVYVENGRALRATKLDRNGQPVSANIYKVNPKGSGYVSRRVIR